MMPLGHSANIIDQDLFVFGGYDGDTRFNTLWQVQNVTSIRKCGSRLCTLQLTVVKEQMAMH